MYKLALLLACIAFTGCSDSQKTKYDSKILCADIGATRIKAQVLHPDMTLSELQRTNIFHFPSNSWLNERLPLLFSPQENSCLMQQFRGSYDVISFGITGPVADEKYYVNSERKIPRNLKQKCTELAGCPVFVENDAIVWARGALVWQNLMSKKVQYPCLAITLGTGAGIVLLRSPDDMVGIEIYFLDISFSHLKKVTSGQPDYNELNMPWPHNAIGEAFFVWARNEHPEWDDARIQLTYNERIAAFVEDMQELLQQQFQIQLKSVMIGGGNSRYTSSRYLKSKLSKQIMLLNAQHLAKHKVSSDIIALLGCIHPPEYKKASLFPSWDDISRKK